MKVRCERDSAEFSFIPQPYPNREQQTSLYNAEGDLVIDCPVCHRGYFLVDKEGIKKLAHWSASGQLPKKGDYFSDRVLTIISK